MIDELFQRTPNYSIPAGNRPLDPEFLAEVKANYAERRRLSRLSGGGTPNSPYPKGALEVDAAERTRIYDEWWQRGGYCSPRPSRTRRRAWPPTTPRASTSRPRSARWCATRISPTS